MISCFSLLIWSLVHITICHQVVQAGRTSVSFSRRHLYKRTKNGHFNVDAAGADIRRAKLKVGKHRKDSRQVKRAAANVQLQTDIVAGLEQTYFGSVSMGTPPQTFNMIFDTGSADIFVAGPNAPTISTKFDPKKSSTYKAIDRPWTSTFVDGSATEGELASDTFAIGNFSIKDKGFAMAETGLFDMLTGHYDGIVGMSFSGLSQSGTTTLFERLAGAGVLTSNVFCFHMEEADESLLDESNEKISALIAPVATSLPQGPGTGQQRARVKQQQRKRQSSPQPARPKGAGADPEMGSGSQQKAEAIHSATVFDQQSGMLTFGEIDHSKMIGDIVYTDVVYPSSPIYWESELSGLTVDEKVVIPRLLSIIDTGTTLAFLPPTLFASLARELVLKTVPVQDSSGVEEIYYALPCAAMSSLNIGLQIGSLNFKFNSDDLNLGPLEEGSDTCVFGLMPMDLQDHAGVDVALIGDIFLRSVYSIFDFDEKRIGFGKLAAGNTPDVPKSDVSTKATSPKSIPSSAPFSASSGPLSTSSSTSASISFAAHLHGPSPVALCGLFVVMSTRFALS